MVNDPGFAPLISSLLLCPLYCKRGAVWTREAGRYAKEKEIRI
jgi:hypothetical protein